MKKIILALLVLISTVTFAQETTENPYTYYLSTGISITNSDDFQGSSFVSTEVGVMRDNISVGAVLGRNNLVNIGENESFNNYWYEGKVAVSFPLGKVDGYALAGVGSYIENGNIFTEYGLGVSKYFKGFGVFVQMSNWDSVNYISSGLTFNLN